MLKISRTIAEAGIFACVCLIGVTDDPEDREERQRIDATREIWRLPTGARRAGAFAKMLRLLGWYRSTVRALRDQDVRCVNAHSLAVLPLGVWIKLRHRARLVYDTHELETETASSRGPRRKVGKLVEHLCLPFVDEISVVNEAIATWYRAAYHLPRVHVVRNLPYRQSDVLPAVSRSMIRQRLEIPDDHLIFLYQGLIAEGRGIDQLIAAFAGQAEDRHLLFMGYGARTLDVVAAARRFPNVHYLAAVDPDALPAYTAAADVGLAIIENVSLSYYFCLPNKLFEYLAAGLPVIASDLPCMRELIEMEDCGWLVPVDVIPLAELVRRITADDIHRLRPRAIAVQHRYAWQSEESAVLEIYHRLFHRPPLLTTPR
jgi:glycosyltransferase involved in cell wall biosynthesis